MKGRQDRVKEMERKRGEMRTEREIARYLDRQVGRYVRSWEGGWMDI